MMEKGSPTMSFSQRIVLVTAVMLSLTSAQAQQPAKSADATPAPRSAPIKVTSVEGITEYRLPNGLRVLLFPDPSKPTVTVNMTYLVGSRHEGYGETGMAHLLEHLLFKGTPKNPDIPKQFNQRGARYNGTTSFDRTNYYEMAQASEDNLRWAINLEADRMINSNISRKDLDSEMSVVRNEYERGENNPSGVLFKRMQSIAFDWHNYQNSPIGNRSDIENVEIPNLRAFYRKYYQPDNAVLLVAGQFDEAVALKMVNEAFGKIPKPTRVLRKMWTVEPTQDGERNFSVRRTGNLQLIMAGYKVPSGLHPDSMAISFASAILGSTPSGRLHKALVETNKAAQIGANSASSVDPNLAVGIAVVKEGEPVEEVQKLLLATIESFGDAPPTEEEMNRVRLQREKSFDQVMSSPESLALALSESVAAGDWRLWFNNRELAKKVTAADVARVSKAYFRRDNRTVGVFVPTSEPQRAEIGSAPTVAAVLKDFTAAESLAAGEAFDPSPANIDARTKRYTLPNGMKVALLQKKTRGETVNVSLRGRYGDEQSRFNKSTAEDFAGAMMTRGTTRYTRAQLADEFDRLKFSGGVGLSSASFRTTKPNLIKSLELTAHILKEPTFPETELEQLRKQALTSIESGKSEPGALADEMLGRHFNFYPRGDVRYYSTRDEDIEDVKAVTIAALKQVHKDFTGFSNAELAIVGDFDEAEVRTTLANLFGNWTSPVPYKRVENPFKTVAAINNTLSTPDKENAVFRAQLLVELRDDDPEYPALAMANYMFGGGAGLNARVAKRIRGKEGLSYGANTGLSVSSMDRRGTFSASATAAPQNIAKLESIFREELDLARKSGFTTEELANAKSGLLTSRRQGRAQDGFLASAWTDYLYRDKTFAEAAALDVKYQALTLAQVNAALNKYIVPENLVIVKAGDFSKVAK
jgi:zinc protease